MKKGLLILVIIAVFMVSCVRLGSTSQSQKPSGNITDTTGAMAQNPGGMQSLPGAQPGSISGFNQPSLPAGAPVAPAIDHFNLSGQGGNQPSSMGDLQSGGQGGGSGGDLPAIQSGGSTGTMSGFNAPPPAPPSLPAGVPAEKVPYFEKDLTADTTLVTVGDTVFLNWKAVRADNITLTSSSGKTDYMYGGQVGFFVVPDVPGAYIYTITATNNYASVSQKVDVTVLSPGQREIYAKYSRCRTFMVYPQKIKKGEMVTVYWNVLDAQLCYLENNITNSLIGLPDSRDRVNNFGEMRFWPLMDTTFVISHVNGTFPSERSKSTSDYASRDCFVEVR